MEEKKYKSADEPVSDEAMERLAQIMNDSPSLVKLKDTEWEIRSLKPGTMWMIAEEAAKISKVENASFGDVLKEMTTNFPSVCRILTLALINDKKRIDTDYQKVYDTILWETEVKDWANLLFEVLNLIGIEPFFQITGLTQTFKQIALERKTKITERNS
jgi:hypothetical protein